MKQKTTPAKRRKALKDVKTAERVDVLLAKYKTKKPTRKSIEAMVKRLGFRQPR